MEEVILVNEQDEQLGSMEKMEAHRRGVLHRAFSIFVFNNRGEMLLQQRAGSKYHSGGLWTNACCGHPRPGEDTGCAAARRLTEELNFDTPINNVFNFSYQTEFANGLTENEFDHVYTGIYSGDIHPNPSEVQDYCFKTMEEISSTLASHPHKYTAWFRIVFPMIEKWLSEQKVTG